MSDIVDRLNDSLSAGYSELRKEAAQEILQLRKERDALQAKVEAMERQEPVELNFVELRNSAQKIVESYVYFRRFIANTPLENDIAALMACFVFAQPAPSVPDLLESLRCACNYIDKLGGVSQQYRAMLAAAPEAKPCP